MADTTNFEGFDHDKLRKLVADTDPSTVLSRGTHLQSAGRVLKELSEALKSHIGSVQWEGPAADSFKSWAGNLQQSALILGDYSTTAGDAMHLAGEALSTAKAAVPEAPHTEIAMVNRHKAQSPFVNVPQLAVGQTVDAYMKTVNPKWVTGPEAAAAEAKVQQEHQEAVLQMEKLAQAYSAATTQLNGLAPDVALPGTPGATNQNDSEAASRGGGEGGSSYGGSARSGRVSGGSTGGSYSPSGGGFVSGGSVPIHQPGSGPQGPSGPGHTDPIPPHGGGGQVPPPPHDPGSSTPPSLPSDPINRPGTGLDSLPTVPTLPGPTGSTGPLGPGGSGSLPPDALGGLSGYQGGPGSGPGGYPGGIPGGGPVGGFPGGSVPARSGGSVPGKSGGSFPGRTPINGGSVPGKGGTSGLPSGTVFGAREAQAGRGGTANGMGGMHPGGMGGHGVGGSGGSTRGRGLTSTSGGTVGGRKGPTAGGEFTPGGTGLRRAGAAGAAEGGGRAGQNGMMAPGMGGGAGRNERDRRKRADYLQEDEETWTAGTPHSNPDVVE
ncbi:hypothetical protein [Kitasatospora sp. NPDC097643]|uniref:WXG100 family type VII secretion target n=1 Tax=Kitasatospora sp. NPDC097643 TaxID=3157230 RepID=UPI00332D6240